mmetsp:Transcript_48537/g.127993  ORF Transcript_48537/g.127993 Transcript_48537/m.127993 type:complete len:280 (-) Transcript_48537:9-848(-)
MPFDCRAGGVASRQAWGADQRKWCCSNYGITCERLEEYDCKTVTHTTPTLQKTWCCLHREDEDHEQDDSAGASGVCGTTIAQAKHLSQMVLAAANAYTLHTGSTVEELARTEDEDHDGVLSKDEFASFIMDCKVGLGREAAEMVFAAFDTDGNGQVHVERLAKRARVAEGLVLGRKFDQRFRKQPKKVHWAAIFLAVGCLSFIACAASLRTLSSSSSWPTAWLATWRRPSASDLVLERGSGKLRPSRWRSRTYQQASQYEVLRTHLDPASSVEPDTGLE